jgi:HK97 family phage major capsid protein
MSLSNKAILEISELSTRAEKLARGSVTERKQADILIQRIGSIKQIGLSIDEVRTKYADALLDDVSPQRKVSDTEYRKRFDEYITGRLDEQEFRDFLAGSQAITYTQGASGGFFVPLAYDSTLRQSMAQVDPLLDETVTDFTMTSGPQLQPETISGFDLSTINAVLIGEDVQANPQGIPTVKGGLLRADRIFKASFASSYEAEQDVPNFPQKITRAGCVALARRIGVSIVSGRGGTDISGITQSLSSSYSNATSGKLTLNDLTTIFFNVNRWYRAAPKCGWLLNDGVYKFVRQATDTSGRPLLSVEDGQEILFGKPIYVSPSCASIYSSLGLTGCIIFGDLSSIVVRASRPQIQRYIELAQADITKGEALWIARVRADATYFDPSGGVTPPLTLATIN